MHRATDRLLALQERDGSWRDYDLEPGRSDAWITAVAGTCLASVFPEDERVHAACARAAAFLEAERRAAGWGYNRNAACDADTTSWVVRFLAQRDRISRADAESLLRPFFDAEGRAHTFNAARFGSWAHAHEDVTPNAGLALLAAGVPVEQLRTLRETHLAVFRPGTGWTSFWWSSDSYANALSLEFLDASGGIPDPVRHGLVLPEGDPPSAFEAAQRLTVRTLLGLDPGDEIAWLHAAQLPDGSWSGAPVLRVPDQSDGARYSEHADTSAILTTGLVIRALRGGRTPPGSVGECDRSARS
ncbi:MAG: hypothetical protein R3E98_16420 [Gemmatimonadota bacterium]